MATIQERYNQIKEQYPDTILLFRVGDFYEVYHEDAKKASKTLSVTLTHRGDGTPLCGFPFHALDSYLPKLVRAGYRVAICCVNPAGRGFFFCSVGDGLTNSAIPRFGCAATLDSSNGSQIATR